MTEDPSPYNIGAFSPGDAVITSSTMYSSLAYGMTDMIRQIDLKGSTGSKRVQQGSIIRLVPAYRAGADLVIDRSARFAIIPPNPQHAVKMFLDG